MRAYYERELGRGFDFAYIYPGFNRVLQAIGRVIRSEEDRGVVVLIDDRFAKQPYRSLFPPEWRSVNPVESPEELEEVLRRFWSWKKP